ncbi:calcium-binding protein [Nocardioides sp.]|uniref:calcium-binding protein n=1 Tax=Nocardioides sp. TaxID=35761 RepID=UPI002629AC8F|nr:calcium-binding protein [Nocardioides sp.]
MQLLRPTSRLLALVLALGALTAVAEPLPAQAAVRASNGERCTIVGTSGNDTLIGTRKRDVICGLGGNDVIKGRGGNDLIDGGAGDDRIEGGPGADRLIGGSGADVVLGQAGDDTVSGDDGVDVVDGGPGFNLCDVPHLRGERYLRCAKDNAAPVIGSVTVNKRVVNVSRARKEVVVRVAIRDDTGVASVQVNDTRYARLVAGTPRNGVWALRLRIDRFVQPGPRDATVRVKDRVGRETEVVRSRMFVVRNSVVDRADPVVSSITLSRGSVDVRSASQALEITATVTDDAAGPGLIVANLMQPGRANGGAYVYSGANMTLEKVRGTAKKSIWRHTVVVPRGAESGRWNVMLTVENPVKVDGYQQWYGPESFAVVPETLRPWARQLAHGKGGFDVIGGPSDVAPPSLISVRLSPATVDTVDRAPVVTVEVTAADDRAVTEVFFSVDLPGRPWIPMLTLTSGTARKGVWRVSFVVPQGTPDGAYPISVALGDRHDLENWYAVLEPYAPIGSHVLTPALAPTGTRLVVANPGGR